MDLIGKSPVSWPEFIVGKAAFFCCAVFFLLKAANVLTMHYDSPITSTTGTVVYGFGLAIAFTSLTHLGKSAAVGLPERETELKTHGLYRFTRNPVYLGAFLMGIGSCLFAIHVVNFFLLILTTVVHLRIVKREEAFLEKRFGQKWLDYKDRVPRFIGIPKY